MAPDPTVSTKIPAPSSLLDPETSSLPPTTRNALLSHLQESNTIQQLNSLLTDSLTRTGWTERVHELTLELLRNGDCTGFGEVLNQVTKSACQGLGATANGGTTNGVSDATMKIDVTIPQETIEKSVKFLKDEIDGVIEVVHDEKNGSITNGTNGHKK